MLPSGQWPASLSQQSASVSGQSQPREVAANAPLRLRPREGNQAHRRRTGAALRDRLEGSGAGGPFFGKLVARGACGGALVGKLRRSAKDAKHMHNETVKVCSTHCRVRVCQRELTRLSANARSPRVAVAGTGSAPQPIPSACADEFGGRHQKGRTLALARPLCLMNVKTHSSPLPSRAHPEPSTASAPTHRCCQQRKE